jgi:multidrug transporter EmrE-like cation transporter
MLSSAPAAISLFFMYARGAQLSVEGVLTEVISVIVIAHVGLLLLKEPLSFAKAAGLMFSAIGIVLLFQD